MRQAQTIAPDAEQLHRAALTALEQFRMHDAVRHLKAAVLMAPRRAAFWNDLGVVLEALGHQTEALRCYRTALDRESGHAEAKENYEALRRQMALAQALRAQIWRSMMGPASGVSVAAKCRAAAAS